MSTFFLVLHLFTCLVLIMVVLVQSGKDGGLGMMSGGGSQTVFGSSGGANFFTKFTSATAAVFMITSIVLTMTKGGKRTSVFDQMPKSATSAPAASGAAPTVTTTAPNAAPAPNASNAAPAASAPAAPAQQKR